MIKGWKITIWPSDNDSEFEFLAEATMPIWRAKACMRSDAECQYGRCYQAGSMLSWIDSYLGVKVSKVVWRNIDALDNPSQITPHKAGS